MTPLTVSPGRYLKICSCEQIPIALNVYVTLFQQAGLEVRNATLKKQGKYIPYPQKHLTYEHKSEKNSMEFDQKNSNCPNCSLYAFDKIKDASLKSSSLDRCLPGIIDRLDQATAISFRND